MKINKYMIAFFVFGLNAIIDSGTNIGKLEILKIIKEKQIISYLIEEYSRYWDFTSLLKYEEDLSDKLLDWANYLDEDSYRKLRVERNGFVVLSSVATHLLLNAD